jgi:hypothetical protein
MNRKTLVPHNAMPFVMRFCWPNDVDCLPTEACHTQNMIDVKSERFRVRIVDVLSRRGRGSALQSDRRHRVSDSSRENIYVSRSVAHASAAMSRLTLNFMPSSFEMSGTIIRSRIKIDAYTLPSLCESTA